MRSRIVLSALLTSLALGGAASAQPAGVSPPEVLDHVDPEYPPALADKAIDTTTVLLVTVERDGRVSAATVAESGGPEFDKAALAAITRWRFIPASKDGAPARARIRVPFHFAPGPHASPAPAAPAATAAPAAPAGPAPVPEPVHFDQGVVAPHSVEEPGKPIEIHVQGRPNPPRRAASDFRLDRRVLAAAPHQTAADLLATAPGVHVSHPEGDAVAQRIFLRGFDADHGQDVELRVGGIPLNQPSHVHGQGYADLNVIIPEVVRSVRVVEGVYDPSQGDFAVAGSVDFDLGVEERGVLLKGSMGSFGTRRALAVWAPRGESEDTFGAATFRSSDGFGDGTRGSLSGGGMGQYRFQLPEHFSGLLHVAGYAGRASLAGVVRRDDVLSGRVGFYDAYSDPSARAQSAAASRTQVGLTIERTDDDGSHASLGVWAAISTFRSRMNFTGYRQRSRVNPEWVGRGDLIEQSNSDTGLGGSVRYRTKSVRPWKWLRAQLGLGAELQTDGIDQAQNLLKAPQNETWDQRVDATIRATDIGAHVDGLLAFGRYVRLRGGLRADLLLYDVDDRLGNFTPSFAHKTHLPGFRRTAAGIAWGPRVTLEGDPTSFLRLTAAYGEGYRSPQARQLEEGEQAPFAKVKSYEVGAKLHDADAVSLSAAAYETRLSYDLAFDASEGRLERTGPTTRRGLVGYLQVTPTPDFMAAVSATYVRATLDGPPPATPDNPTPPYREGQALPYVPPVVLRTDLSYKIGLGTLWGQRVDLRLGAATTFLSPKPLPYDQQSAPVFLVDGSVGLRRGFLEVSVDGQNLLDAQYADSEYSFVSSWQTSAVPSQLPTRHLSAGAPLTLLANVAIHL